MEILIGLVIILAVAGLVYLIIKNLIPLPENVKQIAYYVLALITVILMLEQLGLTSFGLLRR